MNKRRYYKTEERAKQVLNILKQNKPKLAEQLSVKYDRLHGYYLGRIHQINNRDEVGRQYNEMSELDKDKLIEQMDFKWPN